MGALIGRLGPGLGELRARLDLRGQRSWGVPVTLAALVVVASGVLGDLPTRPGRAATVTGVLGLVVLLWLLVLVRRPRGNVPRLVLVTGAGLALTITEAAPPTAPFSTPVPVAEGQVLNPDDVVHQTITFTPTVVGAASGTYLLSSDDGSGPHTGTLIGTGVAPSGGAALPAPTAGGWSLNGAAKLSGTDLQLTQTWTSTAGRAVFPIPVLSEGLHARFTAVIGGGTGADGMTFTLLNPTSPPSALGAVGGGLGYAGLPGVAVALDTYTGGNDPSANFVAVATGGTQSALTYAAASTAVGDLRTGTHVVDVTVTAAGHLVVAVDGAQVIDVAVTLPGNVIPGFTAATGGKTDQHIVRDAVVSY